MTPIRESAGQFPLTGVKNLPHVSVAFPGEHWSDRVASGSIVPGEAIIPAGSANSRGQMMMRTAKSSDTIGQLAIALRPIDVPDPNNGPNQLGPNEVRNKTMAPGEYVHAYYSGAFTLTLVDPTHTYSPGATIGWDANGPRPEGIAGEGSWAPDAQADIDAFFEVISVTKVGSNGEVILKVRTLRSQF
jgi:hypothetical protein